MAFTTNNRNGITNSQTEVQQFFSQKLEEKDNLALEGNFKVSDYVKAVPASPQTVEELRSLISKQREVTRTNLAMWQAKLFGYCVLAIFLFMGFASVDSRVDKAFIKDTIPLIITPQVTLLGVALGFYFGRKEV